MKLSFKKLYRWAYFLSAGFLYLGCVLRSIVYYQSLDLIRALVLLLVWLGLYVAEIIISPKWQPFIYFYLAAQSVIIFIMAYTFLDSDFFCVLYAVLGMQTMQAIKPKLGLIIIALFTPLTAFSLTRIYDWGQILPVCLVYLAANALLASYSYVSRKTLDARARNVKLMQELENANDQLQSYSREIQQFSVARERNRLARELHDSVTQTIFSMTLTTQSAQLLLKQDPSQVSTQLDRLNLLAHNAQKEMHQLISQLRPMKNERKSLEDQLREHIDQRLITDAFSISMEISGDKMLRTVEEQSLFRIAQEALNNIMKHTHSAQATIRLHLDEPCWMEIEDQGQGFDSNIPTIGSGVGLASMQERADGIGWTFDIHSAPGKGTIVRVEKRKRKRGSGNV